MMPISLHEIRYYIISVFIILGLVLSVAMAIMLVGNREQEACESISDRDVPALFPIMGCCRLFRI